MNRGRQLHLVSVGLDNLQSAVMRGSPATAAWATRQTTEALVAANLGNGAVEQLPQLVDDALAGETGRLTTVIRALRGMLDRESRLIQVGTRG